ncbi:MAG: aminomethyl-transferring glycine dehydrogenase subunit GcvPB [Thermoanaerobaculales bacterium]|jgi:glycine dehydrogenase subunit 2|nr:aminomethyl-transferring glycine dehydrogenase subunit GcvPB [Thermoanaerobaculales bacterium]
MKRRALRDEPLIFERNPGRARRQGFVLPPLDVPAVDPASVIPAELLRHDEPGCPDVGEMEVVQHFHRLSQLNYAVDEGLYPLGSCTMKYNPRLNEQTARFPGLASIHPLQPPEQVQGALRLIWELERALLAITGMAGVTLQPAAGAHGELAGILMIRRALAARGDARSVVLVPDSAHGTNPATAAFAGYEAVEVPSAEDGTVDLEALDRLMTDRVAAVMLTVPNTLGVFEHQILEISRLVHDRGGLVYMDGANLNAFVGRALPGRMGADAMHINLHKTFSTPHGGGGPGAGPVVVSETLVPHLPVPRVVRDGESFRVVHDDPASIGPMRGFFGNFLILVRALTYIRSLGADGLREMSSTAVLYANLIRHRLAGAYHLPYRSPSLHEVVLDDSRQAARDIHNVDIAKRLLDHGFHPPTMSFPLIVHGALMIEPAESVPPEEIDAFCDAMLAIAAEAEASPEVVRGAPHDTPVSRVDEVRAARQLKVRWTPEGSS